jgi:hypothetical protein
MENGKDWTNVQIEEDMMWNETRGGITIVHGLIHLMNEHKHGL